MKIRTRSIKQDLPGIYRLIIWSVVIVLGAGLSTVRADELEYGYVDFGFGSNVSQPTGEKPESKLWWNDGFWWGALYNSGNSQYEIHRFNLATQSWTSSGVAIDNRNGSDQVQS